MTIQQCKYILSIAEAGSLSGAAKSLFVAQSSLSESVMALEEELGISIFERCSSGVFLTPEGAEFVRYAKELVSQNDFILKRYEGEKAITRLYVSTQHYDFVADIFAEMIKKIDSKSYKLALKEKKTYEVIHEVEKAYSDIGVIAMKNSEKGIMKRFLSSRNLTFTPVFKTAPHVFLRKNHPLANEKKLLLSCLSSFPYVSYEQGEHNNSFFTEEMHPHNADKHIEISDRASLMNVLLATDGFTIGTGIMPSQLNRGSIVSVPLESTDHYIIGYILRTDRIISPVCEQFISRLSSIKSS